MFREQIRPSLHLDRSAKCTRDERHRGQVFPCDIPGGEIGDVQLEMNLTVNLTVPARHRPRPTP